jgi:hypothetical protein
MHGYKGKKCLEEETPTFRIDHSSECAITFALKE